MYKEYLKDIIYILVAVIISIIAVKIFIWLLPIILIIIGTIYIYNKIKKNTSYNNTSNKKNKKIVIIDSEDIN